MAYVRAISGVGGKGPACFLVDTGEARLLFDLGQGPQPGRRPEVGEVGPVDAIVLSHGHPDHAGALDLAARVGHPPVYATAAVLAALEHAGATHALPLSGTATVCGVTLRTGRNGHAPGGVWLHAAVGAGLLYMGDCSVESLIYAYDPPPPAGTVILDASYGAYDAPLAACMAAVEPLLDAPTSLWPVPVRGRGPEIAYHIARTRGRLPRLGADLRAAMRTLARAPENHGVRSEVALELGRIADEAAGLDEHRGPLLAGAADGGSGEAGEIVARWAGDSRHPIVFTGYLPPGTPAQRLTDSGRAQYVRWNAHPRLADNAALVRCTQPRTVVPAFGDRRHRDAWMRAFAPARVVDTTEMIVL